MKPRKDVYGSAIVGRKWRSFEYHTVCGPSHAPTVLRARAHLRACVRVTLLGDPRSMP